MGRRVEPSPGPVVVVEQAPGVTLRVEIERRSAASTSSPADLRIALERLVRAALEATPPE